jgi:(p)ppGpp synthase/HD superfamily hydrolase
MDEIAEKGLAAHFKYKGIKGEGGSMCGLPMREILESTEKEGDAFLDQVRSGLYTDEVFVFTPKGDLRQLPAGSTLLDFAFDIHTAVGASCVGGKVNGRNVTLRYQLQNGIMSQLSGQKSETQAGLAFLRGYQQGQNEDKTSPWRGKDKIGCGREGDTDAQAEELEAELRRFCNSEAY